MILANIAQLNISDFKWDLAYLSFIVLISLLFFRNKKIKGGLLFLAFFVPPAAISVVVKFYISLIISAPEQGISYGFAYIPTVLFVLSVYYSVLFGLWRGLRKSALFLLHAVCAAAVCIGLYFFFIKSAAFDKFVLKAVNFFMGGNGALQNALSVSTECNTMRQVLTEWLPAQFGYGTEIGLILADNGAYLATLVDIAFSVTFATVSIFIYYILIFLLWIVYHIAYPERRYKRKKQLAFAQRQTDRTYKKHTLAGGAIGLMRGIVAGILALSISGGAMYMVVGNGTGGTKELISEIGNDDIMYAVYRAADEYGSSGIYKILNAFGDSDGSPYYLFATDVIFSARLKDDRNGINETIKLRKEIAAYREFAADTLQLLIRYGGDDITSVITGKNSSDALNKIIKVMKIPAFQAEFEELIDGFDSQTYIINFALSAANSIVANIDDTSFAGSISQSNRELLKLMFKQGYLSDVIPEEREALSEGKTEDKTLPYIGLNKVFNKQDAKALYRMVLSFLDRGDLSTLDLIRELLPQITSLSMFDTKRESDFDPVFGRLYCYAANKYLTDGEYGITYKELKDADVAWVSEINSLVTVADNGFELYDSVRNSSAETTMDKILSLFNEDDESYGHNIELYDNVTNVVSSSKIIGNVLTTKYVGNKLKDVLSSVNGNMYIPDGIRYENHQTNGIVQYGELYQFLKGVRLLGSKQNRELINKAVGGDISDLADMLDLVGKSAQSSDESGKTLAAYMTDSVLIRSLISSVLISNAGDTLYIPKTVLETDSYGNEVNLIQAETISGLFDGFKEEDVRTSIVNFINGEADITDLLGNDKVYGLLMARNGIIEGTVSKLLIENLSDNDFIVMPIALSDPDNLDGWITYKSVDGELCKIATALNRIKLDLNADTEDKEKDVINKLLALSEEDIDVLFDSDVMYYTISEALCDSNGEGGSILEVSDGLKLIVPNDVKQKTIEGDSVQMLILKPELRAMFKQAALFNLSENTKTDEVLCQIVKCSDHIGNSMIISASIANFMCGQVKEDENTNVLTIPKKYKDIGTEEKLVENLHYEVQTWQNELVLLADALDVVFGITDNDLKEVELNKVNDYLEILSIEFNVEVSHGVTKLDVCCESDIMMYNVSKYLDEKVFSTWQQGWPENKSAINPQYFENAKRKNGSEEAIYPKEEIKALVNSITVFGLQGTDGNITKINVAKLKESAKNSITRLNEPCYELNAVTHLDRTGLDYIYDSVIINSIITKEIDDTFVERTEEKLRETLKVNEVYRKEELKAIVAALNVLDIEDGKLENLAANFGDIALLTENLDVFYKSRLIANSVTKAIKDAIKSSDVLVHHNKAYENGSVYIYKIAEVRAVIGLIDGGIVGDFRLNGVKDIMDAALDGNNIKSYLIAASVTLNVLNNENLIVPYGLVEKDNVLTGAELRALLNACYVLCGDSPLGEWKAEFDTVPDNKVLDSAIIRATVTDIILDKNKTGSSVQMLVGRESVSSFHSAKADKTDSSYVSKEQSEYKIAISKKQLEATFNVLRIIGKSDNPFAIPELSLDTLYDLYNSGDLDTYLDCDVIRFRTSDLIEKNFPTWFDANAVTSYVIDLSDVIVNADGKIASYPAYKLSKTGIKKFFEELGMLFK